MAFAYLNPQGRIWQANGLKYLLSPRDLPDGEGLCSLGTSDTPPMKPFAAKTAFSAGSLSREGNANIGTAPVPASPQTRGRPVPGANNSTPLRGTSLEQAGPADRGAPGAASARAAIPPEAWPQLWRQQLIRTKKARFAWTYMDLGGDLLFTKQGQGEEGDDPGLARRKLRSQCLRKLLADLAHPLGTHTFWPIALPEKDGAYLANVDCFWSGLDRLGCRGVIFMGKSAARAALGTDDLKPLSQLFKNGKLVWILWEPDEIAKNPIVYETVLPFLRRSLGQFVRN